MIILKLKLKLKNKNRSWFTNPQWSKFALWEFVYCRLAEPVVSSTATSVFVSFSFLLFLFICFRLTVLCFFSKKGLFRSMGNFLC